jgi:hypothetical protein
MTPSKHERATLAAYIISSLPVAWALIACFTPIDMPPQWLVLPAGLICGGLWTHLFCELHGY